MLWNRRFRSAFWISLITSQLMRQIVGNVLDGHALREFQSVTSKGFGIGHTRIGKTDFYLPDNIAFTTLHAGDQAISK